LIAVFCGFNACAKKQASIATEETTIIKDTTYEGDNYRIGVILPLTGRYQIYGESTLHGIECAAGIFKPCEANINAELIIKNDGGDAKKAALAVEELVNEDHVSIIVGPLTSRTIAAAAKKAEDLGVPLISLSQSELVTNVGDNIFSVGMEPTGQVNSIVDWARNSKRISRFAILYPMNRYGELYKKLFEDAVKKSGGSIAFSDKYGETTLDFAVFFKNRKESFDALFIPDSYKAVSHIIPTLVREEITGVQLLGINRWNNQELIERGGPAVQGAVFVDGFFEKSNAMAVSSFVNTFHEGFGINPTILEAQGYDATRLAMRALQNTGGAHPEDVRTALFSLSGVDGATGEVYFDKDRQIVRDLFLLTVSGDKIVEIQGPEKTKKTIDKYGEEIVTDPDYSNDTKY